MQDGFANRLGGNGAGVNAHAADAGLRSTITARLPSLAALNAAFCPAGPEPITTRSYEKCDIVSDLSGDLPLPCNPGSREQLL